MSRAMTSSHDRVDAWLLEDDAWDSPGRLTDTDLFTHAGPGWRRGEGVVDDPEDDR